MFIDLASFMSTFCLLQAKHHWFYNCPMRFTLFFALSLSSIGLGQAQTPASAQTPADANQALKIGNGKVVEQRTERIHVEDAGASIDELRVGGETRSITVQPRGGMPAYEIAPGSGERNWKVLSF